MHNCQTPSHHVRHQPFKVERDLIANIGYFFFFPYMAEDYVRMDPDSCRISCAPSTDVVIWTWWLGTGLRKNAIIEWHANTSDSDWFHIGTNGQLVGMDWNGMEGA